MKSQIENIQFELNEQLVGASHQKIAGCEMETLKN